MRPRRRRVCTGLYVVNGIHKIQFSRKEAVDVELFAADIFSRKTEFPAVSGVRHIRAFIEPRFRIIAYLMRNRIQPVCADGTPRIVPRKRIPHKAEYFFCIFVILDFSGKSVLRHPFLARIKIETADQRIRKMLSRNGEIPRRIIFPSQYQRHEPDFFGYAAADFKLRFFRTLRVFLFRIRRPPLRYDVDDAAHRIASVQNGIRALDDFDSFDVFDGNLKDRRGSRYIGRNAHTVYHDLHITVSEPLHRDGFVGVARRSGAHCNIGKRFQSFADGLRTGLPYVFSGDCLFLFDGVVDSLFDLFRIDDDNIVFRFL